MPRGVFPHKKGRRIPVEVCLLRHRKIDSNGCWIWTGSTSRHNGKITYGRIRIDYRNHGVHRVSYELYRGTIPSGLTIDHLCRQTLCFNPDHLEAVSLRENILRGNGIAARSVKKTHCKYGHPFSKENTKIRTSTTHRLCIECERNFKRAYRERLLRARTLAS